MRVKLTVAYDGTDFRGWALQQGQRTVRGTLEEAIQGTTGHVVQVIGASRTDSGAHAKGQVCHFDIDLPIPPPKWPQMLNRVLVSDLAVIHAEEAGPGFHSRFCAEDRFYRYRIRLGSRDPFMTRFCFECPHHLDPEAMREAAKALEGTHDFLAFTEELDPSTENTTRTLRQVQIREHADEIHIDVVGTAFLRGMMRRMAGGLLEVGRGHRTLQDFEQLLTERRSELQWPVVLPAKGLTLMGVRYANPPRDCRLQI